MRSADILELAQEVDFRLEHCKCRVGFSGRIFFIPSIVSRTRKQLEDGDQRSEAYPWSNERYHRGPLHSLAFLSVSEEDQS